MNNPIVPYLIVEAYCLVYGVAVLFRLNSSIASQHEIQELRNVILTYFGMLIFDILSISLETYVKTTPIWILSISNGLVLIFVTFGCFFWFAFIAARFYANVNFSRKQKLLFSIPMVLIVIFDCISMGTGWIFYIDSNGSYSVTDYFWFQVGVNFFYLLIPTVISIRRLFTCRSSERKEYWVYALYMIAPLTAGLLEDYVPTTPLLALNIFLAIHVLF